MKLNLQLPKLLVIVLAAGVLGGARCHAFRDCCDDDDRSNDDDDSCDCNDDDDDGFFSSTAVPTAGGEAGREAIDWKLHEYQLLVGTEPGAPAVAGLIDIRGFSLSRQLGPGVFGNAEIQLFTGNVLHGNQELFALPAEAGRLRFDAIDHQEHFILVSYVQERVSAEEIATLVPDATLTFVLDLHGRLIEIQNRTRLDVR